MVRIVTSPALVGALGGALAGALAVAATAFAQEASPGAKAAQTRQAHYKELGKAFAALGAELRKEAPDRAAVGADATAVATLAQDAPTWFPKGSGPEAGVKTAAKAEIWTDASGFAEAVAKLQADTAKLQQVAAAGDLEAVKAEARAAAGACKACHDKYRAPEQGR